MQLRTEIQIAAPKAHVWKVLTEFSAYPEWNPFVVNIDGHLVPGSQLSVALSLPEGGEWKFRPTLLVCDPYRELRWKGKLGMERLFTGEHFFRVEETSDGCTRFIHGEDFSGLLVRFMGNQLTQASRGFVYMNQALKRRVESEAPTL
jgi:hypothetical protein